ncbi:hypothetical protein IMCC3088_2395 [Aequoribacter fuscus]|jgi:hypothetical protein|uniref:Uncharacterized protein n=1 Tax=Aequoribacter fuscus TaxID=2518989 RepID=F3L414_9GAMM|nr:DUF4381 domain-containing protein [Aequoribacter fuscus]EGG28935.1 hypothetical protein IMCC3088_2395 [Aequoribacter fuscus]QHJ88341.1 DUF4381 domain-containing protein [Aequoribacter fuscus]
MNKVFDSTWGNPVLRSFIEPEFPEQISLWPQTPGWWLLLALIVVLIIRTVWRIRQRYLANRYRREALAELSEIKLRLKENSKEAVRDIAPLLKATAVAAAGREAMSNLQGLAYAQALSELAPDEECLPIEQLEYLAYAPLVEEELELIDLEAVIADVERWIIRHRVQDSHA